MEARKSEDVVGVRDVKQVLLGRENVFIHHLPRTVPRVLLDASKKLEAQSTIFTLISTQALKTGETPIITPDIYSNIPSQRLFS